MEGNRSRCDYEFDCPRFVDFNNLSDDDTEGIDEWFDVNHYEEEEQEFADAVPGEQLASSNSVNPNEENEQDIAATVPIEQPASTHSGTVEAVKIEKPDTDKEIENLHHSQGAVKTEPKSSEEDIAKGPSDKPVLQQHHGEQVKEEPMSTEDEEHTEADRTETNQHQHQQEETTVKQEKSSDEADTADEGHTEDEEMVTTQSDTGEDHTASSTEKKSETESSDQCTENRVTPRKKPFTPRRSLRRSTRKSQPANIVTSWEHRRRPASATKKRGSPRTRRSTPPVLPTAASLKSTEQMELERIKEAKEALEKTRQMSQQSLKMVRASHSYQPKKSQQPPTRPHGFHFQTDNRIKTAKELEREAKLEKQRQAAKRRSKRRPVIKAPLLMTNRKRVTDLTSQRPAKKPVKTFALQVSEFQNKTPDRFHSKPVYEQNKGPCPAIKLPKMGVTVPMSPALKSKTRKRPVTVLSTAEREELEVEEIKKYKFKANPNPNSGCSRANTSMRSVSSKESREEEEEKFEFHARPVPAKILEKVTGVGEAKHLPITCPKSPAFALKKRIRPKEPEPPKEEESEKIKARPVPHLGIPFKPTLDHRTTNPEPFSFEDRDRETLVKKEAKVQELFKQEQEARIFHAKPVPDLTETKSLPEKKVKPPTKVAPFNIDHDGAKRAEKWAEEMKKELEEQKKRCSSFKAKPPTVLYQEPFVPEKTNRPLTDISDFTLNTEKRAVDREDFERYKYEVEMRKLAEAERQRQLEEEEARREVARLRQEAVHKAQPVHHFKGVKVQPSDKPLTMAESPRFTDRRRSKAVDQ